MHIHIGLHPSFAGLQINPGAGSKQTPWPLPLTLEALFQMSGPST